MWQALKTRTEDWSLWSLAFKQSLIMSKVDFMVDWQECSVHLYPGLIIPGLQFHGLFVGVQCPPIPWLDCTQKIELITLAASGSFHYSDYSASVPVYEDWVLITPYDKWSFYIYDPISGILVHAQQRSYTLCGNCQSKHYDPNIWLAKV